MNKFILLILILLLTFTTACGNDKEKTAIVEANGSEVEYTKEIYLIETANDIREIRSLHDKLIVQLAEEAEKLDVAHTFMELSVLATDNSYQLTGTESFDYDLIREDLDSVQSYVDEKYKFFSDQKELDRLSLNLAITQLETLIGKLESDFKTVY